MRKSKPHRRQKQKDGLVLIKTKSGRKLTLTREQGEGFWDSRGPYSESYLTIETRILDEEAWRVWVKVEALINPFTFEFVNKQISDFVDDHRIYTILIWAEYCKKQKGYLSNVWSAPLKDGNLEPALKIFQETQDALIRMHKFVINNFDINKN